MSQVEIGKKVNKIEGHEREAKEDTYPFLTAFALRKEKHKDRCENFLIKFSPVICIWSWDDIPWSKIKGPRVSKLVSVIHQAAFLCSWLVKWGARPEILVTFFRLSTLQPGKGLTTQSCEDLGWYEEQFKRHRVFVQYGRESHSLLT